MKRSYDFNVRFSVRLDTCLDFVWFRAADQLLVSFWAHVNIVHRVVSYRIVRQRQTVQNKIKLQYIIVTFPMSRRRREMCSGHARVSGCVSVRSRMPTLLHGPGCNLGEW